MTDEGGPGTNGGRFPTRGRVPGVESGVHEGAAARRRRRDARRCGAACTASRWARCSPAVCGSAQRPSPCEDDVDAAAPWPPRAGPDSGESM
eukprot:scaffold4931_cov392-Prasinococcus_capsulatus_cf.AAC.7